MPLTLQLVDRGVYKSLPPSVDDLFRGIPFSHEDKIHEHIQGRRQPKKTGMEKEGVWGLAPRKLLVTTPFRLSGNMGNAHFSISEPFKKLWKSSFV